MIRPRTLSEWLMVATIAVTVAVAIILPVFVVRTISEDTEEILTTLTDQLAFDQQSRIAVNAATLACIDVVSHELVGEERIEEIIAECINDILAEVPSPEESVPDNP